MFKNITLNHKAYPLPTLTCCSATRHVSDPEEKLKWAGCTPTNHVRVLIIGGFQNQPEFSGGYMFV